jgi:hypothetical protein
MTDPLTLEQRAAEIASDVEQRQPGAAANSNTRDSSGPVASEQKREIPSELVGSSGHIVRRETAEALSERGDNGSPGAQADREAAQRGA